MNKIMLVGRVGVDPSGGVANGSVYSNIVVGTNEFYINRDGLKMKRVTWHKVVCWGRIAEFSNEHLCTGRLVMVEGRVQHRQYTDREGITRVAVEVVAQRLTALDPKPQWMTEQECIGEQHGNNANQNLQQ